jgi:hypothetical protein
VVLACAVLVAELELLEAEDPVAEPPTQPVRGPGSDRPEADDDRVPIGSHGGIVRTRRLFGRSVSPVDVRSRVRNAVRMNVRTNLLLPKDLVDEVDRVAGPRGRSRYVTEALRAKVKRDRLKEAIEMTAGVLRPEDYPEWSTSEKVVEWVRARRAETTDSGK